VAKGLSVLVSSSWFASFHALLPTFCLLLYAPAPSQT
jgi:hypothetical protein